MQSTQFFPPPEALGSSEGKDSISEKKLHKGDAIFKRKEVLLVFEMCGDSGQNCTVKLPPDRKEKYSAQIHEALSQPKC